MPGHLHVDGNPLGMQACRHLPRRPHKTRAARFHVHADHDGLGSGPCPNHGVVPSIHLHLLIDPFGGTAKRHLSQSEQISFAKEILQGLFRLLRHIDLAVLEPLQKVVRRQVDEFHVIGPLQDRIGNRLADFDAGNLRHLVVQTFQVLNIDGGVYV